MLVKRSFIPLRTAHIAVATVRTSLDVRVCVPQSITVAVIEKNRRLRQRCLKPKEEIVHVKVRK